MPSVYRVFKKLAKRLYNLPPNAGIHAQNFRLFKNSFLVPGRVQCFFFLGADVTHLTHSYWASTLIDIESTAVYIGNKNNLHVHAHVRCFICLFVYSKVLEVELEKQTTSHPRLPAICPRCISWYSIHCLYLCFTWQFLKHLRTTFFSQLKSHCLQPLFTKQESLCFSCFYGCYTYFNHLVRKSVHVQ